MIFGKLKRDEMKYITYIWRERKHHKQSFQKVMSFVKLSVLKPVSSINGFFNFEGRNGYIFNIEDGKFVFASILHTRIGVYDTMILFTVLTSSGLIT